MDNTLSQAKNKTKQSLTVEKSQKKIIPSSRESWKKKTNKPNKKHCIFYKRNYLEESGVED